jgi:hypothetical protein
VQRSVARQGVARFTLSSLATLWNRSVQSAEFFFLEAALSGLKDETEFKLVPLSMKLLAGAAIQYENDPETLEYVQRSAARLRLGNEAFALLDAEGSPVHICWVAPFDGFQVPGLKHTLAEPAPHSAMLFDPWTCDSQRSRSAQFTAIITGCVSQRGQQPWICTDRQHLALFEAAGFVPRFSLIKRKKLFLSGKSTLEFRDDNSHMMGLHPAA